MALQFGPTKIGAMQYNGVTIGEAMYNGQIVYTSQVAPVAWVDDFTTPALDPRWTLIGGGYTPPGLGGQTHAQIETSLPAADCEISARGTTGQERVWGMFVRDEEWGTIAEVYFDSLQVNIGTEQGGQASTVTTSPTDLVTLRIVDGMATVLVNGTPVASAPTGLGGDKWLTVSVDGPGPVVTPRITYLAYTPL